MDTIQSYQKYLRISPRKLKVMTDSVKNLTLDKMLTSLSFIHHKTAKILLKVLKQAVANAKNVDSDLKKWTVASIQILKGPTYKRWQPVSRGRAHSIMKRTCHVRIVLKKAVPVGKIKKIEKNGSAAKINETDKSGKLGGLGAVTAVAKRLTGKKSVQRKGK